MGRFRVYLKPFNEQGEYVADYEDITEDVSALADIRQSIENTDFDVGVIRNSGFNISLRNDHGRYSDVDTLTSMFRYSRKNSLIKITWDANEYPLIAGFFECGNVYLGGEQTLFEGLIQEVTSFASIGNQDTTFSILGFESLLDTIEVPFSDISNGDLLSEIILAMIDQAPFNERVTVSALNIVPATDVEIDTKDSLQNKTVSAALKEILKTANSVLYIKDGAVYVTNRDESVDVEKEFFGQASIHGLENIIDIPKYRDGFNRVFNLWTWDELPSIDARDTSSIDLYGVKAKEVKMAVIDVGSTTKIQTLLDALRDEFSFPYVELELETPFWYDILSLNILDKVTIDYPTIAHPFDQNPMPRYGQNFYNSTARYPYPQWSLTISSNRSWKITSKKLNIKKQTVTFGLREVNT